jgi:UDP-4-amino-4,6-dideoxy-N-acetyl-beta-L-altrosamine N-acetyltransferase
MSILGLLRVVNEEEIELMRSWRNAPTVRLNMYTRHEISPSEHMSWWAKTKNRNDQKYLMYEDKGIPKGIVGFTSIDRVNANCSWAFYADPDAPKGTGSRMEYLAIEYAFETLKIHKLYCEVLSFNENVIKLHQKFGFAVEGVFKEHHFADGEYVDIYRLAILANEWGSMRNAQKDKLIRYLIG